MKKVLFLSLIALFSSICIAQTVDPILFTVAGKNITKSEFDYFWKKNNQNDQAESLSKEAYLDMFITFKQKVAEAEAQGIDKDIAFKVEFDGYRKQLTAPYFTDTLARFNLKQQLYQRYKQYAEVSHIQINSPTSDSEAETQEKRMKVMGIYYQLLEGDDFYKLAQQYSDDVSTKDNGGYLGINVGIRLPFDLENTIFQLKKDSVSLPIQTDIGYHIIKLHKTFPAWGRISSGHIMKTAPENASKEAKAAAKDSIFAIYKELKKGGDFFYYATNRSDDKSAAANGGKYTLLDCGIFPYVYDSVVHSLKIGAYSAPFQTKYGWHIVKALDFQPYLPFEHYNESIEQYIDNNQAIKDYLDRLFVEDLVMEYNLQINPESEKKIRDAYSAKLLQNDSLSVMMLGISNEVFFNLNGVNYPIKQYQEYLYANPESVKDLSKAFYAFIRKLVLEVEDKNLEKKYPEFGQLMQEYRDGMLLFEISNKEVWEKSSNDSQGLQAYFNANKTNYNWDNPRFKGALIRCADEATAKKVKKQLGKLSMDSLTVVLNRSFNSDTVSLVLVEQGLFAKGDNPQIDFLAFKQAKPESDKKYPIAFLRGKVLKTAPESYKDVMGQVVMDYQYWLEENWVKSLKAKYPVVVNKEVLNTVNNN